MKSNKLNLETHKNNAECPLCEGSGWVYKTLLMPLNKEIFVCDECLAVWLNPEEIEKGFLRSLSMYIKSLGYDYEEVDLKKMDYGWYERDYLGKK